MCISEKSINFVDGIEIRIGTSLRAVRLRVARRNWV